MLCALCIIIGCLIICITYQTKVCHYSSINYYNTYNIVCLTWNWFHLSSPWLLQMKFIILKISKFSENHITFPRQLKIHQAIKHSLLGWYSHLKSNKINNQIKVQWNVKKIQTQIVLDSFLYFGGMIVYLCVCICTHFHTSLHNFHTFPLH